MTGGSAAPLSTATLLSTLEIGLGPSAARPLRRGAGWPIPNTISGGGGPSGGQRVGLRLVESSTTGPQRLPLPCRFPPVVRARRHPRKRNSPKECLRRACPCKSSTGLEEYPPRARFLRLRRSVGRKEECYSKELPGVRPWGPGPHVRGRTPPWVRGLAQNLDEPCRRNSGSRVLGPPKTRSQNYSGFGEVEKNS